MNTEMFPESLIDISQDHGAILSQNNNNGERKEQYQGVIRKFMHIPSANLVKHFPFARFYGGVTSR